VKKAELRIWFRVLGRLSVDARCASPSEAFYDEWYQQLAEKLLGKPRFGGNWNMKRRPANG